MNSYSVIGRVGKDAETRFRTKRIRRKACDPVTKSEIEDFSIPVPEAGCWLWTRGTDKCGYGKTYVNGRHIGAHRASYLAYSGPIPVGQEVRHKCDTPLCVNPDHLLLGTHKDNSLDRVKRLRSARLEGRLNPSAKLDESKVIAIRNFGGSAVAAAKHFGVSLATIYSVINKQTWRNVA
jgi:hypothetical protein